MMKKLISLLLAVVMLATLCVSVNATDTIIDPEVKKSISEDVIGVAFRYTLNARDVAIIGNRTFQNATITVGGVDCTLVKVGAIVTNQAETAADLNAMVIENVTGERLLNIEGKKLFDWNSEEGWMQYAVRITHIPEVNKKSLIYSRPYYIYEDAEGQQETVYGAVEQNSYETLTLPAVGSDIDVTKKKNRIRVSDADYTVLSDGQCRVSLKFRNYTSNWITEETDYVKYTCYDAAGNSLENKTIYIGCIDTKKNKEKTFTFDVPAATAEVALTSSKIIYWTEWA